MTVFDMGKNLTAANCTTTSRPTFEQLKATIAAFKRQQELDREQGKLPDFGHLFLSSATLEQIRKSAPSLGEPGNQPCLLQLDGFPLRLVGSIELHTEENEANRRAMAWALSSKLGEKVAYEAEHAFYVIDASLYEMTKTLLY